MIPVVLASKSPRRTELLTMLGVPHRAEPAGVDETVHGHETPAEMVVRLAREKAAAVAPRFPGALVVGADTLVFLGGHVLGQPKDEAQAREMLRSLAGRTHTVLTGVCLLRDGAEASGLSESRVTFHPMTDAEIAAYVASGEPMDKAGAYAAQGLGAVYLKAIEGSFHNVVGFPVDLFAHLLPQVGLTLGEIRNS